MNSHPPWGGQPEQAASPRGLARHWVLVSAVYSLFLSGLLLVPPTKAQALEPARVPAALTSGQGHVGSLALGTETGPPMRRPSPQNARAAFGLSSKQAERFSHEPSQSVAFPASPGTALPPGMFHHEPTLSTPLTVQALEPWDAIKDAIHPSFSLGEGQRVQLRSHRGGVIISWQKRY
jgi:hypothetical protein